MTYRVRAFDVLWTLLAVILLALMRVLFERMFLIALLLPLAWLVLALSVIVRRLFAARKSADGHTRLRDAGVLSAAVALVALLAMPVVRTGAAVTHRVRFQINRDDYDRIVEREKQHAPRQRTEYMDTYVVDVTSPLRIAFREPGGFLDNWCAFVYDPTGKVMKANESGGAKRDDPEVAAITKLFGGDLTGCVRMDGPYYHCCFT